MKTRTNLLVIAAFLTALPFAIAHADEATSPEMTAPHQHSWDASKMQKKLGLSDDQVAKLKTLKDSEMTATKPLMDKQHDLMKTLGDQVKSKAKDADIQTTLTALKTNMQAMRDQREQFRTQKEAILTPTQQAQMLLARMKHFRKMKHGAKMPPAAQSDDNSTPAS